MKKISSSMNDEKEIIHDETFWKTRRTSPYPGSRCRSDYEFSANALESLTWTDAQDLVEQMQTQNETK